MMKIPPQHNTTNPPGQIVNPVNLEQPLTEAIEAFQGTTIDGLRQELRRLRKENLRLYLELEQYKAQIKNFTKFA